MQLKPLRSVPFFIKLACVLFSLIAMAYIAVMGKEILSPLVFSCLCAILLLPLANTLEKRLKLPRGAAALLSVLALFVGIGLVFYLIGSQASGLAADWPQFRDQLNKSVDIIQDWIARTFQINAKKQWIYVQSAAKKIMASGTSVVGTTVLSISSMVLFQVFVFIYTFFFLLYRRLILRFLVSVFREENKAVVFDIAEQVQFIIRKYIIGLFIEMAIVAAFVCIVFSALGVKHAILLGLLTGVLNLIPYIGIFTALALSTLVTFATAAAAGKIILVAATIIGTHLIDSNVLLPLIVGSKVRINALITVLGVVVGEMIWGIPGMFLSIPVLAVLKIVFDRVESLKPWGILMGEDTFKSGKLAARLTARRLRKGDS